MRDPCPFAKPNLHANTDVMQTKQWPKCQKPAITVQKKLLQKGPETEKKKLSLGGD